RVSVNMLDAAIAVQMQELSVFTVGGVPQRRGREPHGHTYIRAPYGVFATKDGYVALGMPRLDGLAIALDLPELAGMDGHTQRDEITSTVARRLPERTTAEWLEICARHDLWAGPVYGYAELVADPQVRHNGSFVTYDHRTEGTVTTPGFPYGFSATPPQVRRGAPLVGEHTAEILGELGYPPERTAELVEKGVLACED
ncbi:MAG TPA: CoA transferase, partial [Nonomuraea sp.]|nr:CoA transferase [Nonomuraea sp.]